MTRVARPVRCIAIALALLTGCATPGAVSRGPEAGTPGQAADCSAFARPEVAAALDARTGSIERTGNDARLLVNGEESFARRFENAREADVLLVKTFILADDEVGTQVAHLLAERARAGAYVVLQYDVRGSMGRALPLTGVLDRVLPILPVEGGANLRRMREAGVLLVPAASPTRPIEVEEWARSAGLIVRNPLAAMERAIQTLRILNHANHEKVWITGHRRPERGLELRAIVGGMNLASEYGYGGTERIDADTGRPGWRDTDVEVAGPVVNDIAQRFWESVAHELGRPADWTPNPPQPARGETRARFVWNAPLTEQRRAIEQAYETLIDATPPGSSIRIANAYFVPGSPIRRALRRAVERGVQLSILTNSADTNDVGIVSDASRAAYDALLGLDGDVALYERIARPDLGEVTLHAKVASFGSCGPIIVGSANLDAQSSEHNSESVLILDDPRLRERFAAVYDTDVAPGRARRITPGTAARDPLWKRARRWSVKSLAWYWL